VWYGPLSVIAQLTSIGPHIDLAIISRPHIAPRYIEWLRELLPAATVAYDTVDLHHVRERRRMELAGRNGSLRGTAVRELELALMRSCDVTIAITDEERDYIDRTLPGTEVVVLPNAHRIATVVPGPGKRDGLLFVGGFEHPPNVDAAIHLVEQVMPLVWRELGDVPLTIVGADAPPVVNGLAGPNVIVRGWVPDMEPLLGESRAMVAPLRYGAGMKGKVTQSLAAGLPVVTTTIGAEGLNATAGEDLLIADDPAEFAAELTRLYRDDELWSRLSAAGQKVIRRVASVDVLDARLRDLLASATRR
jgi:glycosyltransferase involved in cell wall biosynthesis